MSKVIVDTSVWIDHFRGRLRPPLRDNLGTILIDDQAAITDIILHELLVGAADEKHFRWLADRLGALACLTLPDEERDDLSLFGFHLKTKGLLGRYTDLTIAYLARRHDFPILSFDGYFKKLSSKSIVRLIRY